MEVMASSSDTHFSLFASTYDSIESPQYISFADNIPEAKDSFFDRRNQDLSSKQLTNKHYQTLPNDVSDDFIRPLEKIGLKNPTKEQEKIITSTPFRVQGLEPFPWRVNSKPQAAPNLDKQKTGIKMQPFSFDERNKQLQQRKIERVKTRTRIQHRQNSEQDHLRYQSGEIIVINNNHKRKTDCGVLFESHMLRY
ncbi:uncharacterized protein [Neodiprion pinetum]|uniref:uncharacterized protein isoform X2 n=1 Tax=Neodiprion pinetum TaxID=441929 RepID=UPI00371DDBCD